MVKLCKNYDLPKQPAVDARFIRRTPSQTRFENRNPALRYKRARIYSAQLGRFISRDPLGFVDGLNLYRAYFVPASVDPSGSVCQPEECVPPDQPAGQTENGNNRCFCPHCGKCYEAAGAGFIDCPRAVCATPGGSTEPWKHLSPGEDSVHEFMVTICEELGGNPCKKICKRFSGRTKQLCLKACKEATGGARTNLCEKIACLGVTGGLPGYDCLEAYFQDGELLSNPSGACKLCCDSRYPQPQGANHLCKRICDSHDPTNPNNW